MWLKQSTSTSFLVGPVLDASGLPVTTAGTSDFRISKAGTTAIFSGGTATHDTNGNYKITLTTGNTDTIGSLEIGMHNTSYAMSVHRFMVIEPTIFDDLVSTATNASGGLRDVARINGQTVSAAAPVTFPASVANETTVASKASQASVDTLASYVDTEVAAIKAKTDNLPPDPADASDIAGSFATVNATLATIAGYIDTEVAAIKAKTDNLPIDPADASDIAASFASLTGLVNTLTSYVDTEVAAIKAKTDNLPAQPAAVSDIPTASANASAVWSSLSTATWPVDSFGRLIIISDNNNRTVKVLGAGAGHIAADVHAMQTDVISAASVSAAAVTKIQTGLASQTSVDTLTTYVDTEVAAIKAKTDNLPVDPADASDIAASFASLTSQINVLASYVDTEVLAIKAKTDNLPAQPAAVSDIPTAAANASAVWSFTLSSIVAAGSAAKVLSDAGTGIATLLTRITTTVYNTLVDLAQMIVNDGTVDAQWSAKAMENVPVAGGTGARTVTITVRDPSSNPIQNASVRVSRTGETFVLQTNASGVVVFSLNDATWTVAITATGFSFSPVSLVVAGNVSQTYNMTAAGGGVTPSEPPFCTGYFVVYNQNGTIQAGAQVSIQASSPPVGSTGIVMEDAVRTATADNNGVVQFSNLVKGATYIVYRTGSSRKFNILVPTNAGSTQPLASIVG